MGTDQGSGGQSSEQERHELETNLIQFPGGKIPEELPEALADAWEGIDPEAETRKRSEEPTSLAKTPLFDSRAAAPGKDPMLGRIVAGKFKVEAVLGQGGFGTVYRARDMSLDRLVALKFLRGTVDARHQELFEREAKAIARLSRHPGIVDIYEWGEHAGENFFAMAYVDSGLKQCMDAHPDGVPVHQALSLILQCAEALEEAHEHNILHRDIKPANILLDTKRNQAKLTDFGLARIKEGSGEFTIEGSVSGTPAYMSPEQASPDRKLDARSDLFSLGVTLYEMLSSRRPFEGETGRDTMEKVRKNDRLPLAAHRPDLPESILAFVEKAMAHEKEDRFQNAGEFVVALKGIVTGLERSGQAPTLSLHKADSAESTRVLFPKRMPRVLVAALIAVVIFAALSGLLFYSGSSSMGPSVVLAKAREEMNQGAYAAAQAAFEACLQEDPRHAEAAFGLFLAQVHLGALAAAKESASRIADQALQQQAQAALAVEAGDAQARASVEAAAALGESAYLDLLYARLDAMADASEAVVDRLAGMQPDAFPYRSEYADALQLLGQAYYRLGEDEQAQAAFALLADSPIEQRTEVARRYLASLEERMDAQSREAVREAAERVHALLEAGAGAPEAGPAWTSRPLTFFILPMKAKGAGVALELGLVDLLPYELGNALDRQSPMNVVDRSLIEELLAEQELSALVGSKSGQLSLGRVLGARLLLECEASRFGGKEKLLVRIDDVETTERIPLESLTLNAQADAEALVAALGEAVWEAVAAAYPLQGKVWRSERGLETDLGTQVGLKPGMHFALLVDPQAGPAPGITLTVQAVTAPQRAVLQLEGMAPEDLPEGEAQAWYIRQLEAVEAVAG